MNKESGELSPAQREVASHLLAVARRGSISARDERHAALHGTSLEMVMRSIENGKLVERSGGSHGLVDFSHGDIAVFPTAGMMIPTFSEGSEWAKDLLFLPEEAEESARGYAKADAQTHYLLQTIGLSIDNRVDVDRASNLIFSVQIGNITKDLPLSMAALLNSPEAELNEVSYFSYRGVDIALLQSAIEGATNRKGFLLGINPEY